jgi:hypothetical protein
VGVDTLRTVSRHGRSMVPRARVQAGMSDPLATLVHDLREHGKPSLRWILTHAPDGDITRVWNAGDASPLHTQLLLDTDRRRVVTALCAAARLVVAGDGPALATIDAAEQWARGLLCSIEVGAFSRWVYDMRGPSGPQPYGARVVAYYVAYARHAPRESNGAIDLDSVLDSLLTCARNEGIPESTIHDAIRAAVPAPTLADLIA